MFIMSNALLITKCIDYCTFYGIIWSERKDKREKKVIPLCNGRFFAPDTMCIFLFGIETNLHGTKGTIFKFLPFCRWRWLKLSVLDF